MDDCRSLALRHPRALHRAVLWTAVLSALWLVTAGPAFAQPTVVLVRHAELVGGQMASPADMPLSPAGSERAQKLAQTLASAGVTAIYTTDFARTQLTAAPLKQQVRLEPVVVPKAESASLPERIRREHPQGVVVVVGHSDTLPTLLKALADVDMRIEAQDFGNLFVVAPVAGGKPALLTLRY
jgi:broad specificity phosphatase PhoE